MRIPFKDNMEVARKVLTQVQKIGVTPELAKQCDIQAYANGREQGFHIRICTKEGIWGVSFSEYRRSDSIVVYSSRKSAVFSMQGNCPDEDTYNQARFFKPGEYEKAAKFIVKFIEGK
jgi:hypothetical protein